MNRIFISYRSSDGKKEAGRLCADLSRVFGDEQVFFDKQDLRGGLSWRAAIESTLGSRPVVLLLITPDLLGEADASGARRLEQEGDPIRAELLAARQANAVVVPLLTEGMQAPSSDRLPEPLQFITEAHALRLRTDDWNHDLARLVNDLQALGLKPSQPEPRPPPPDNGTARPRRKWLTYALGGVGVLVVLGLIDSVATDTMDPGQELKVGVEVARSGPAPVSTATPAPAVADLSGAWWSIDRDNRRSAVQLAVNGNVVELRSAPIPVAWYPEWRAYAQQLLTTQGIAVSHVVYRAVGNRFGDSLDLRFEVFSADGAGPLDTGSFTLKTSANGREMTGQLYSNGDQSGTPVHMVRGP